MQSTQYAIRQRELLNKLGIPVWVERGSNVVTAEVFASRMTDLAGDSVHAESAVQDVNDKKTTVIAAFDQIKQNQAAIENTESVESTDRIAQLQTDISNERTEHAKINHERTEPLTQQTSSAASDVTAVATIIAETTSDISTESDIALITPQSTQDEAVAFDLFAMRYKNSIIFCDSNHITNETEAALWQNMKIGLLAEVESLSFPLSEKLATDMACAKASLAGWLYRLMGDADLQIVILGETPTYFTTSFVVNNQASLSEMVEQPLLKKALWQTLKT